MAIKANPSSSIYILSQIFTQKSRTILLLFCFYSGRKPGIGAAIAASICSFVMSLVSTVYDVLQWLQLYSLAFGLMALSNIGMRLRCIFNCLFALVAIASSLIASVSMPLDTKCWMRACSTERFAFASLLACANRGRVLSDASTIIFSVILLIIFTLPRLFSDVGQSPSSIYILSQIFIQKSRTILLLFCFYFAHSHQILHGPTAVMWNGWYVFSS